MLGLIWGGFSFLTFDLVRNDGHFSTGFPLATASTGQPMIEGWLLNKTQVPLDNLHVAFQFYRADGTMALVDANEDRAFTKK